MNIKLQHGFTLIEVMITVVIIAILASIALPSYQNAVKKSKVQAGQSDLVGLGLSAESVYQRQLSYPTSALTTTANVQQQFTTWHPASNDFDYSYTPSGGTAYTVTATGKTSTPVAGCVLTLTNAGVKNVTSCDPITQWIN